MRKHAKLLRESLKESARTKRDKQDSNNLALTIFLVCVCFFVFAFPLIISEALPRYTHLSIHSNIIVGLYWTQFSTNFIIYAGRKKAFQNAYMDLLSLVFPFLKNNSNRKMKSERYSVRYSVTTMATTLPIDDKSGQHPISSKNNTRNADNKQDRNLSEETANANINEPNASNPVHHRISHCMKNNKKMLFINVLVISIVCSMFIFTEVKKPFNTKLIVIGGITSGFDVEYKNDEYDHYDYYDYHDYYDEYHEYSDYPKDIDGGLGNKFSRALDMEKTSVCDLGFSDLGFKTLQGRIDMFNSNLEGRAILPTQLHGAKGVIYEGYPLICGGMEDGIYFGTISNKCYRMINNNMWRDMPSMTTNKIGHSMAVVGNDVIVTGGTKDLDYYYYDDDANILDSIDILKSNRDWKIMNISTPNKAMGHCLVPLSDTRVMSIGGHWSGLVEEYDSLDYNDYIDIFYDQTWILDVENESWSKQAPMLQNRAFHGCAKITDPDGKVFIIVSGGNTDAWKKLKTTEMYDIVNDKWSSIADLPMPLTAGQLIADGRGGVLMIGGDDGADQNVHPTSDIFYMATKDGAWEQTFKSLDVSSSHHVAILVSDSLIIC